MFSRRYSPAWSAVAFALLETLAWPQPVQAAPTIGSTLQAFGTNIGPSFGILLGAAAYVLGLALFASGLIKLKEAFDRNAASTVRLDAGLRMAGGSLLVGLLQTMGVGISSLLSANFYSSNIHGSQIGATTSCLSGSSGVPLTCMAQNFMVNVVPVGLEVIFGLCFLAGGYMMAALIYQCAKGYSSGRAEMPRGWATRGSVAIGLLNIPFLMGTVSQTLNAGQSAISGSGFIGLNGSEPPSLLAYTAPAGSADLQKYADLIGYLFTILVLFGVISFVRGILILKRNSEGNTNTTTFGAGTHIIAGILLANAKWATCTVIGTLMGTGFGFCS